MTITTSRRSLCGYTALLFTSSCARRTSADAKDAADGRPVYRGPLVDPAEIPFDFMWQQRVAALHGDKGGAFDAVVQKRGAELLVLGLTPMKTRGFSLTQRGSDIEYEQFVPFELPFAPVSVLYDIHRAFFFELLVPFPEGGLRHTEFEAERVTDEFSRGHLKRRTFENVSNTEGSIVIEYSGDGFELPLPPPVTKLRNDAYGYSLEVETMGVDLL